MSFSPVSHHTVQSIRYIAFEYAADGGAPAALKCQLKEANGIRSDFLLGPYTDGGRVVYDLKARTIFHNAGGCEVKVGADIKDQAAIWAVAGFSVDLASEAGVNVKLVAGASATIEVTMFVEKAKEGDQSTLAESASLVADNSSVINVNGAEDKIIVPEYVYIMNSSNDYLSRYNADHLRFVKRTPDEYCRFHARVQSNKDFFVLTTDNDRNAHLDQGQNPPCVWLNPSHPTTWFRLAAVQPQPEKFYLIVHCPNATDKREWTVTGKQHNNDAIATTKTSTTSHLLTITDLASRAIAQTDYDFDHAVIGEEKGLIALSTSVRNDSPTNTIIQKLVYSYEKCTTGTWNNSLGWEIGQKATFSAGVPFISSAELELSMTTSGSHEWGGSESEKTTISSDTSVEVPPLSKGQVKVVILQRTLDLPFSYIETRTYPDQSKKPVKKYGIYRNLDSYHVDVQSDFVPI
ncbi:hypothetical protein K438DRAFT_1956374 [Mycena galopus ATCC 62051]|nr:hypothetical protein K438DRAFT_1956374 [Mycena galopus ATCC 62051]